MPAPAPPTPQHECLAGAVYFESKGEPLRGQLSVAEVILNRARSGRFPASVCGVVKQRGQFSFVRGGRIPAIARASLAWKRAVAIAHIAREDLADGPAPASALLPRQASLAALARSPGSPRSGITSSTAEAFPRSRFILAWPDGRPSESPARTLLRRRAARRPGRGARSHPAVLQPGHVRALRGAAAQRPARRHDGDRFGRA